MAEKILVVDDDLDTLRLVGLLLQRKGYQIVAASGGKQAIEKALLEQPDLILLDVMMPDMDGLDALRKLRSEPETAEIPVIMFTAKSLVEDKVTGFEAGADDYLTKPVHPAELTTRVRAVLQRTASRRPTQETIPAVARPRGAVICVLGVKGGLGTTTIAANLAVLLQGLGGGTALAEFRPGSGSIGLMLDLPDSDHLADLLRRDPRTIRTGDVTEALAGHPSGLQVLLSSYRPAEARYAHAGDQMAAVVDHLAAGFEQVVVDLGSGLPPGSLKVIEKAGQVVLVVEPVPNTLLQARLMLDELRMKVLGLDAIKIVLVQRPGIDSRISLVDLQSQLGHKIVATIPAAPELAYEALAQKRPFVLMKSQGPVAQQLRKLAEAVLAP